MSVYFLLTYMTRDQPQKGSVHIPTVTFDHFGSVHFTPCLTQSFPLFSLISRSAGIGDYCQFSSSCDREELLGGARMIT